MDITEVRVFPVETGEKKLKAYATVTFDNVFVVRNLKVIEGRKGLFVAMPSRKLQETCPRCKARNAVRSRFCNSCGTKLESGQRPAPAAPLHTPEMGDPGDAEQRQSEHRDIAHPITQEFRDYLQSKVVEAYDSEKGRPSRAAGGPEAPPVA